MASSHAAGELPEVPQARDVVAFGQEVGRVLSDGRIVGRAEPFAKVFPSSRAVKRAVGVTAWAILEDIALDARLDVEGRLVADTNVRQVADNLGLARNTVTRHLATLREHGFVLHEEQRDDGTGRYVTSRYVLDPSACLERFTVTPSRCDREAADSSAEGPESGAERPEKAPEAGSGPCRNSWDTGPRRNSCDTDGAVSQSTRHRDLRQYNKRVVGSEDQQHQGTSAELAGRLTEFGVASATADQLAAAHPAERVAEVLDAAAVQSGLRSPAGWVVAALRGDWNVADDAATYREQVAADRRRAEQQQRQAEHAEHADRQRDRADRWAAAVSAALDDQQLTDAVEALVPPLPGVGRRSVPMACSRLVAFAAAAHRRRPDLPLVDVLPAELDAASLDTAEQPDVELPVPPEPPADVTPLGDRLAAVIADLEPQPIEEGTVR